MTVGFDSSAVHPKGDTDPTHRTPSEALGTLSDAGYDLLNYLSNPDVFTWKNGMCDLMDKPGLGIEVNEEYVRKMAAEGHDWHNPIWRDSDGVIAEW